MINNPPAKQETQRSSLGQEDPLEKEMATHYSILVWKISWAEEPGGLQSMGLQKIRHNRVTKTTTVTIELLVLGIMLCSRFPELGYLTQLNLCTL